MSSVWYDSGKLYLAEATADTGFLYPAVIEEITLENNLLSLNTRRAGVSSYVATDVRVAVGKIWVTSGSGGPATGGLAVLDVAGLNQLAQDLFLDARGIASYMNTITVMQGTPARLRTYDAQSNGFILSIDVGGANIPESKSTVEVRLDRSFLACGDDGVTVVDLVSNTISDHLPRIIDPLLPPDVTVTNAVTVQGNLLFAANGEAGVYVAQADIDLESVPSVDPNLRYIASLKLASFGKSANFVKAGNNLLFVAGGLNGLAIIEIKGI